MYHVFMGSFLLRHREPMLPEKLSHRSGVVCNSEVCLSEEDEKQTVDVLMTAYGRHSKHTPTHPPHIDLALNMLPTVKLESLPPLPAGDVLNLEESTIVPVDFEGGEQVEGKKRRGRRRKEEGKKPVGLEESNDAYGGTTDDEGDDHQEFSDDGGKQKVGFSVKDRKCEKFRFIAWEKVNTDLSWTV